MAIYTARTYLTCYYMGGLEVEAETEEEARDKMDEQINGCFGTAQGKLRPYFYVEAIREKTKIAFNLTRSEYSLFGLLEKDLPMGQESYEPKKGE